jgi:acyl-coenzyme A thioesterase PaaI-like protein
MATKDEINHFLKTQFPQNKTQVIEVGNRSAKVVREIGEDDLRPGGTVSGPILFSVADAGVYAALLGEIGIVPLAVTTNLSMNFMRKPPADRRIIGDCKLLKVGKSLAVGEVTLYSEGMSEPVAHAVATYSIPPKKS